MSRIITVTSAKGGTGKTTTTSNLSSAIIQFGRNVIAVDGNLTTPNLSLHLGIPFYPVTLHDVIKGRANISEALYIHPSGIRVIPASLSVNHLRNLNPDKLQKALIKVMPNEDFIIVDGAAGLGKEAKASMKVADETLIVTNPELPAITDALKAIKVSERLGTPVLGVVLNRVRGMKHELSISEVEDILEREVLGVIPEDPAVPESIAMKIPVVNFKPRSKAAKAFKRLAATILEEGYTEEKESFWEKLFHIFR